MNVKPPGLVVQGAGTDLDNDAPGVFYLCSEILQIVHDISKESDYDNASILNYPI